MKHPGRLAAVTILSALAMFLLPACEPPLSPVGFRIFEWTYAGDYGAPKPLVTAVWYPATPDAAADADADAATTYANGVVGRAITDAPGDWNRAPCPLIVWSHGYTGTGLAAAYLGEYLAARGFVFAAVDHNDPFNPVRITGIQHPPSRDTLDRRRRAVADLLADRPGLNHARYTYRANELAAVIDKLLEGNIDENFPLAGMMAAHQIGAGGHSMGGYTVLSIIGCIPGRADERIKTAVLHSPAAWMWADEDYQRIAVPTMYMVGQREGDNRALKLIDADRALANTPPPAWYLQIADAHHVSFTDLRRLVDLPEKIPTAAPWPDQSATIARYTRAMFERFLRTDDQAAVARAEQTLSKDDDWTSRFQRREARTVE